MMEKAKKIGIVVKSRDPETCRAAMQYAIYCLLDKKEVKLFVADSGAISDSLNVRALGQLLEHIERLGGMVVFCGEAWELEWHLRDHFSAYLSAREIAEITGSRIFCRLTTKEIDVREFA